jgi:hypothetical protein
VVATSLQHAQIAVGHASTLNTAPSLAAAESAVDDLSEALRTAGHGIGLENPAAWTILDLRDQLESHAVAYRALDCHGIEHRERVLMLQRGVEAVAARLASI